MKTINNPTFQDVKNIVENHGACNFTWDGENKTLVDSFTASGLVRVYEALTEKTAREKFNRLMSTYNNFLRLVDFMWSCVK